MECVALNFVLKRINETISQPKLSHTHRCLLVCLCEQRTGYFLPENAPKTEETFAVPKHTSDEFAGCNIRHEIRSNLVVFGMSSLPGSFPTRSLLFEQLHCTGLVEERHRAQETEKEMIQATRDVVYGEI